MKNFLRYASSFIAPIVMCLLLPYWIVRSGGHTIAGSLQDAAVLRLLAGGAVTAVGLTLFVLTVRMFILIGRGTIMPWDPTRHLITGGLYAHVRNPMILSVLIVLLGEALLFASSWIALEAGLFFVINSLYFGYSEEPGLEKRFGEEYKEYKKHVPRWIPRRTPWKPRG